jgi:hypothetical protein
MNIVDTSSQQLRLLLDIQEITRSKSRYGFLVDKCVETRDPALATQLGDLFTEDAVADFGEKVLGLHKGRAAIKKLFGEMLPSRRVWCWHIFHNPIIDVTGDTASAHWTLYALSRGEGDPIDKPGITVGRYYDNYVRTAAGWKQSKLRFEVENR